MASATRTAVMTYSPTGQPGVVGRIPERAALVRYWADEVINGRTCTSLTLETNRKGIKTMPEKRHPESTR